MSAADQRHTRHCPGKQKGKATSQFHELEATVKLHLLFHYFLFLFFSYECLWLGVHYSVVKGISYRCYVAVPYVQGKKMPRRDCGAEVLV